MYIAHIKSNETNHEAMFFSNDYSIIFGVVADMKNGNSGISVAIYDTSNVLTEKPVGYEFEVHGGVGKKWIAYPIGTDEIQPHVRDYSKAHFVMTCWAADAESAIEIAKQRSGLK